MKKIVLKFIALGVVALISVVGFVGCGGGKESSDISDVSGEVSDVSEISGESEAVGSSAVGSSTAGTSAMSSSTASNPVTNNPAANKTIAGKYSFQFTEEMMTELKESEEFKNLPQDKVDKYIETTKQMYYQMNIDGTFVYHLVMPENVQTGYATGEYKTYDVRGVYTLEDDTLFITYDEEDMKKPLSLIMDVEGDNFYNVKDTILKPKCTFDKNNMMISFTSGNDFKKVS